jgi:hypothetical protein
LGLLTIRELVDYLAPKLNRDEEIYALSLADAAEEFFGESMGKLVRGDSVVSVESAKLLLTAAQKGAFGQQDLLSSRGAQLLLNNLGNLMEIAGRQRGLNNNSSTQSRMLDALDELNEEEKGELNMIVTKILQRSMKKVVTRLNDVPRAF